MSTGNHNPDLNAIELAIKRGVDFLAERQLPSGEFPVLMSTDHTLETESVVDSSPFPTALIAYSIGFIDSPAIQKMIRRATEFFLREMEGPGLWRYWTRGHKYHSAIPPDLDDIACVSIVLKRHGIDFPDNMKILMQSRDRQGLFYTWICPRLPMPFNFAYCAVVVPQLFHPARFYYFWKLNESARFDVDCVVNANVLAYTQDRREIAPVVEFLSEIVRNEKESCCDKWHLNPFTFYYAVSRAFHSGVRALESVRDIIVERIERAAGAEGLIGENSLDTAMAICALLNWGSNSPLVPGGVRHLLSSQNQDGSWPKLVLYYGGPKKYYGWGSEELTTGFCLEALSRFRETYK